MSVDPPNSTADDAAVANPRFPLASCIPKLRLRLRGAPNFREPSEEIGLHELPKSLGVMKEMRKEAAIARTGGPVCAPPRSTDDNEVLSEYIPLK